MCMYIPSLLDLLYYLLFCQLFFLKQQPQVLITNWGFEHTGDIRFWFQRIELSYLFPQGFPGGAIGKESACQCRRLKEMGSIPGSGRSPGEGHGNSLQYSCLENPMDRGAWWATVHRLTKRTPLKWLSRHTHISIS